MKLKIYTITTLFILLSATFSQSNYAQTTKKLVKVLTQDEADKREVTKFADSFVKNFIKAKDLSKMPRSFFDKRFMDNFAKSNFDINDVESKGENFSLLSPFEQNVLSANFFGLLSAIASFQDLKKVKDGNFKNILPSNIVLEFKKSRLLRAVIDEDSEIDPLENEDNFSDKQKQAIVSEYENDISRISAQMRKYLNKFAESSSKNLAVNLAKQFEYYPADICKGEGCLGLPEKTPIFSAHEFLMCLRIVKINGQLKIVQIYSVAMEN